MVERMLWICLAGAVGTGARYLIGLWAAQRFGAAFPYGTLIVNVVGCFSIAAILQVALHAPTFSPTLRLALTTGLLGGFTTYSSFAYETTQLFQTGSSSAALTNFAITTLGCFGAVLLGSVVGRALA
jgi:fluoride exporter